MTAVSLRGRQVRLAIFDLDQDSQAMSDWERSTEYQRLLDAGPAYPSTPAHQRSFIEKKIGENFVLFSIRLLAEERTIGFVVLNGFNWQARSAWVGIGIGDPACRGKGMGSEAMNLLAGYAFLQLNLNRINLTVFGYNPHAVRSYEKVGFVHEGCERQFLNREGQRWDMLYMGLLRDEWLAAHSSA